jgi:hypothetical protein
MSRKTEYLPQLAGALKARTECTQHDIERFTDYWNSLPEDLTATPCPYCFIAGRKGALVEKREVAGIAWLRCALCGDQLFLRHAIPQPNS